MVFWDGLGCFGMAWGDSRAMIANSVFFKTLSKSIYTSNMIKAGGQGGLKRKNY